MTDFVDAIIRLGAERDALRAEIERLRRENEQLCVHGAEPTDEEWQLLRAEVERLRRLRDAAVRLAQEARPMTKWIVRLKPVFDVFDVALRESDGGAS